MRIVLDTNCLIQSIAPRSRYYEVWLSLVNGKNTLCVSNEILEEYEEIIASHTSALAAKITIETILRANNVIRVDAQYRFGLIELDVIV